MLVQEFVEILKRNGIRGGSGVPCSYFTPLLDHLTTDRELDYVPATSEGEAVAIAAGMVAAGKPAFALMQNSGLGNAVNPITSLLYTYRIPVMLFVSQRGEPGIPDEPQHERMGEITVELARLCGLRTEIFESAHFETGLRSMLTDAAPSAWVFRKGALTSSSRAQAQSFRLQTHVLTPTDARTFEPTLTRDEALQAVLPILNRGLGVDAPHDARALAVVSTTGKLSRELCERGDQSADKRNRFYMVGSMGCAAGFGLGIARACPRRSVLVLDGDGALLMKLGSLSTLGYTAQANFHHLVFDNGAHDSTGGQPTASPTVDFALAALACGYRRAQTVDSAEALVSTLEAQLRTSGPTLLRMLIRTGSHAELGRPTLSPRACYERFQTFLREGQASRAGSQERR